jgi:hypothetical protein
MIWSRLFGFGCGKAVSKPLAASQDPQQDIAKPQAAVIAAPQYRPLKRAIAAVLVVFLHYVPQITLWMDPEERYTAQWSRANLARIVLGTLILAGAALGLDALVRRFGHPWLKRLFNHAFLVVLVSGVLAAFPAMIDRYPAIVPVTWSVALVAIAASLFSRRQWLVSAAATACVVFSPLVVILIGQMLTWKTWAEPVESLKMAVATRTEAGEGDSPIFVERKLGQSPERKLGQSPERKLGQSPERKSGQSPVFIFLFDGWSWVRTTRDGQFTPNLKNTRELCRQAILYRRAVSPFNHTMQSLPRLIFQTDRTFAIRGEQTVFLLGLGEGAQPGATGILPVLSQGTGKMPVAPVVPTTECPSIFTSARQHGYATYMLGWFHPYRHLMGGQVDFCRAYFPGDDAGVFESMADELLENSRNWSDPWTRRLGGRFLDHLDVTTYYSMTLRCWRDTLDVLATSPARSCALFHVPVPHAPYVFEPGGSYRPPSEGVGDVDGYLRQVEFVDRLIGQMVHTLRDAGKFDRAMIVITSDHGWQFEHDPAYQREPDWDRHVPLIVKRPRQREGQVVDDPILTVRLGEMVEEEIRKGE